MHCRYKASLKSLKEGESEIRSPSLLSLSPVPFVLFFISLPSLKLTSEHPSLPCRQTSNPALNCRIIHHCHWETSTTLGSFGSHYPRFSMKILDLDCNHECPGIVMENVMNEQTNLRYHLSDIRPLPCLQPTLAIIYREPHRHKTLIQVVITVHGTVCTVNHMLWPARVL